MGNQIKCAIIGLGRIGSTLEKDPLREKPASHAGAIVNNPKTILVAGADPDPEKRQEFEEDWPQAIAYDNPLRMLDETTPTILHIASWTDTHVPLTEIALRRNIPVIVCEKPLANSVREPRRLFAMAKRSGSRVLMNHERRFSADYRAARDIIHEERFGPLLSVSSRLFMGRTRSPRQVIYHDGTHMIDILRFLSGTDIGVTGVRGSDSSIRDSLHVFGRLGQAIFNWEISSGRDHLVFEIDMSFTAGRLRIGNGVFEVWESVESPYYSGFRSLKKVQDGWNGNTGYFSGMMNHAVELAAKPQLPSESSLEDGFEVLRTIQKILRKKPRL